MMIHPVLRLQDKLDNIVDLLNRGSFYSLTDEQRSTLRDEAEKLTQRLSSTEDNSLTVGLLGGTGVGKSTLMNALAGSEIASTSYRRPHTDQILIYRHEQAKGLPEASLNDIPWKEITHHSDAIQHMLLCDLPDFDSLLGEHRQHVLRFLEHLDILIWVTSPEKYADRRFHEFLALASKAEQNFYFVLNKADLLFQDVTQENGYEQLTSVTNHFKQHLKEKGIDGPIFYPLAANGPVDSGKIAPWNQFPSFKQQIFQQRDIKQITAIKAANIDTEIEGLFSTFKKEILNLEGLDTVLEEFTEELEKRRQPWQQTAENPINLWVEKYIGKEILSFQADPSCLLGPGYAIAMLFHREAKWGTEQGSSGSSPARFTPAKEIMHSFRDQLQLVADHIDHRMLRQRLPTSLREVLKGILDDTTKRIEVLRERFAALVLWQINEHRAPSFWGFKSLQFMAYFLLLCFFLFAVGGQSAWLNAFNTPGISSIISLFVSAIHTLFSTKGLAAMGSYALINLFFAFRFYRRYQKLLNRTSRKTTLSIKAGLKKVWEKELDDILERLNEFRKDIHEQIAAISAATQKKE